MHFHLPRFTQNRELIHQNLFCVNPCVAQIHQLWDSYSNVTLISTDILSSHKGAYDLFDFTVNFNYFFIYITDGCYTTIDNLL